VWTPDANGIYLKKDDWIRYYVLESNASVQFAHINMDFSMYDISPDGR
jgi:hypothetical protein